MRHRLIVVIALACLAIVGCGSGEGSADPDSTVGASADPDSTVGASADPDSTVGAADGGVAGDPDVAALASLDAVFGAPSAEPVPEWLTAAITDPTIDVDSIRYHDRAPTDLDVYLARQEDGRRLCVLLVDAVVESVSLGCSAGRDVAAEGLVVSSGGIGYTMELPR